MIYYITKQKVLFDSNIIKIEHSFDKLENFVKEGKAASIDTETTGLDAHTCEVLLFQIGNNVDQFVVDLTTTELPESVKAYLENKEIKKILHNAKFDYKMLRTNRIATMENVFCTQIAEQLVMNGFLEKFPSLNDLTKKYLGTELDKTSGKGFADPSFKMATITLKEIIYAAYDVKYTYEVSGHLYPRLVEYKLDFLAEVEMEATLGYGDMELNGFLLDTTKWLEIHKQTIPKHQAILQELDDLVMRTPETREIIGKKGGQQLDAFRPPESLCGINWNSPAQILPIVQTFLGPEISSTNATVLEEYVSEDYETGLFEALEPQYKIAELLLNYRGYQKALSTYGEDFFKYIHPKTGRIHPNFNQLGAETGRVSCSKPNLQNIKKASDYRFAFVASKGYKLITADYSGCELRIIAEFSGDPVWTEAFLQKEDVHSRVASMLFEVDVTKSNENSHLRAPAKNLNFGLAYGMGPAKLGRQLRIPADEAKGLMKKYFTVFPKIRKFLENNGKFATFNGHITTPPPFNRVRWFKNFEKSKKFSDERGKIERAGKNTPIQGANADLVKQATVLLRRRLRSLPPGEMFLVNQVHDEFVFEVRAEKAEEYKEDILFLMEMAAANMMATVPMIAEATIADCWQK